MPRLRIHAMVVPEFLEARAWYLERSVCAAENLSLRFDRAVKGIAKHPTAHAPWRSIFRRARIVRFPYLILFHTSGAVTSILALAHQRRDAQSVLGTVRARWARFA